MGTLRNIRTGEIITLPDDPPEPIDPVAELTAERARMIASRFQVRAALMQAGLMDKVTAIIAQADPITQLAWAEAVEYRRDSPALNAMAGAMGLDDAAIDDLFRVAMSIVA